MSRLRGFDSEWWQTWISSDKQNHSADTNTSWTLTFHCWNQRSSSADIIDSGDFLHAMNQERTNRDSELENHLRLHYQQRHLLRSHSSDSFVTHILCLLIFIHAVRRVRSHSARKSLSKGIFILAKLCSCVRLLFSFIRRLLFFHIIHNVRKSRFCYDNGKLFGANTKGSIRVVRLSHLFIAILMRT